MQTPEQKRLWAKNNPEKCKEYQKRYRAKPESREKARIAARTHYHKTCGAAERKKRYGITEQHYRLLLNQQQGLCAICHRPPKNQTLAVDHNHRTKKIRGLLCRNCNWALGLLEDNIDYFQNALNYLKESI